MVAHRPSTASLPFVTLLLAMVLSLSSSFTPFVSVSVPVGKHKHGRSVPPTTTPSYVGSLGTTTLTSSSWSSSSSSSLWLRIPGTSLSTSTSISMGIGFGSGNEEDLRPIDDDDDNNDDEDDGYLGKTLLFHIPAKSMKLGGLKLFLFLNMMGHLNTPEKKTWKANQTADNILEMYYRDASGAVIVKFVDVDVNNKTDKKDEATVPGVSVYRFGSFPSMDYMMQEGYLLQAILDELDSIVYAGDIEQQDKLLLLPEPGDAIQRAKDSLSFT